MDQNQDLNAAAEALMGESPEVPEKLSFGETEIPFSDVESKLREVVGVEDFSLSKVKDTFSGYRELQEKYQELEASAQMNPFADSYVEKINELRKGGKDWSHIQEWVRVQNMDFESMSPEQVIMQRMKMERPDFDDSDLKILFEEQFPTPEADEEGEVDQKSLDRRKVKLKEAAREARKYLEEQKSELSTIEQAPKEDPVKPYQDAWSKVLPARLPQTFDELEFDTGDAQLGAIKYKPKMDMNQLSQMMTQWAAQNKVDLTNEGLEQVYQTAYQMIIANEFQDIMNATINDLSAKLTRRTAREEANTSKTLPMGSQRVSPQTSDNAPKAPPGFI
jgi:hypothetical protein